MDLQQLLAQILNPNPGNRLANPIGDGMTQTGLGPDQLARYHAMSGIGGGAMPQAAPSAPSMPQAAPQTPDMQQTASVAAPATSGGGIGGFLSNMFDGGQSAGRNATMQWLSQQGLDEGTAAVLASDKPSLQAYLRDKIKGGGASEFDQRAQAAQQYGLDPASDEGRAFILSGKLPESRGGAAEMSLNTIPGVDENGNSVLIQVDKAGVAHKTAMPEGVKIAKPPLIRDVGTEYVVMDPMTQEIVQRIPKNIAGAAADVARGKATGEAQFDLPRVEDNAGIMLGVLDRMKTHPGRAGATGFIEGMLPSRTSDQVDFQTLVDQTQGQAFLQAFESLKGGGQITETEGAKATQALSRLGKQRLSDADYLKAIEDFESVVRIGMERARQRAGQARSPSPDRFGTDTSTAKSGRVGPKSFSDQRQVIEAIQGGSLKIGDEIMFNGERMRIDP